MSKIKILTLALAALTFAATVSSGCSSPAQALDPKTVEAAMNKHHQDVVFLREEEKLARDVYLTLHKRWDLQIFSNIAGAEQRHMDRMKVLLDSYKVADPVKDDTIGAFTNPKLAKLYTDLVAQGSKSEIAALTVGATIEDLDIRDIVDMKTRTEDPVALDAFNKLECGSRNHMRAFNRQLDSRDAHYTPQFLSQTQVDVILAGDHERCGRGGGKGQGKARGQGQGKGQGQGCGGGGGSGCGCSH